MTITYVFENTLYLNITNRCTNSCDFCVRQTNDGYYSEGSLWLEREPTAEEIKDALRVRLPWSYREIVFCGYGEPTERLDTMLEVCGFIRENSDIKIRLNTNGHSSIIAGRDTAPEFAGLFDTVSVSLNAPDAAAYQGLCHCDFGERGFQAMLSFASEVKKYVPRVVFSVIRDTITDEDIESCREVARGLGIELRVRELV